jgi:asparagine synthase (glutamine-hydrolysing)
MCGINGIFAYHLSSSIPKDAELLSTREAMRTRGPDGSGVWWSTDHRCGLGHRRLSILDLSDRAAQPMKSEDGALAVVFNGEIYNYPQLRSELEDEGVRFRTTSDTEVLLHLYARSGANMVHQLRGMFAFAIWDETSRGLFLARDPYGIKPLYTANDGWTFRFASQVKALLASKQVSRDPEPAGIVGFHLFGNVPEPFTLYREIRALPAGHTQWVDGTGAREPKPFSNLAEVLAEKAMSPRGAHELLHCLRDGVVESLRAHLLADVEVGLFLSAGVDSGSLLGVMRDVGQRDIRAITLGYEEFRGTSEDEVPLAARVCEQYGAEHIVRQVNKEEFIRDLPAILEAMDQPSIDGVNAWFASKAAKEAGLKVVLSGLGGDELLGGYPSFVDLPRWYFWLRPFSFVPGLGVSAREAVKTLAPQFSQKRPKLLGLLQYAGSWSGAYLVRRGLFLPHELSGIVGVELAREGLRRLKILQRLYACITPDPGSDVARVCALESANYMRSQLLRDADWAGMAHGVEVRVPLVDFKLLKFLTPCIHMLRPGTGKAALASVPSIPLPAENIDRAKTGFSVPTGAWMRTAVNANSGQMARANESKGLISRAWSRTVLNNWAPVNMRREAQLA